MTDKKTKDDKNPLKISFGSISVPVRDFDEDNDDGKYPKFIRGGQRPTSSD